MIPRRSGAAPRESDSVIFAVRATLKHRRENHTRLGRCSNRCGSGAGTGGVYGGYGTAAGDAGVAGKFLGKIDGVVGFVVRVLV